VPPRGRRLITSKTWQDLLQAINATPSVELAYPTIRFYRADQERPDVRTRATLQEPGA